MRRTKIVATIGPACDHPEVLRAMIEAGMDVARLNLSHGDVETHRQRIHQIRQISQELGRYTGIMLDTRGPEVRLGDLPAPLLLHEHDEFFLTQEDDVTGLSASVNWEGIYQLVKPGQILWIDDGNIVMRCIDQKGLTLRCEVVVGGTLQSRKKISSPDLTWPLDILGDVDQAALRMGIEEDIDFVAASFIRSAEDVLTIRKFFENYNSGVFLISKIENRAGVDNLKEILALSDGVMVARGDLGVELPPERVPWLQKEIITHANRLGIPVVTATQMLESMTHAPRPTRAEVSDVAHAIWDGSDSVMLSAETASGAYPVESVKMMAKIAEDADDRPEYVSHGVHTVARVADAVSQASAEMAESLGARAIITVTSTGYTARMVSRARPEVPIIALSANLKVARQLQISWGVYSLHSPGVDGASDMAATAIGESADRGYVQDGDLVIFTAGVPAGIPGTTNLVRVETVSRPEVVGMGLGYGHPVTAPVRYPGANPPPRDEPYIAVAVDYTPDQHAFFEKAAAIIAERDGRTSDIAVVAVTLGIPAVVGVKNARTRWAEGQIVTLDPLRGVIYKGRAQT
ncbi:pyruvate kinase [Sulfobacillus sp. hq2]|uniref:pyruvate kinase n=1 Tax=Sulfobacillus TaxID=28033 RepID=UPI001304F8A5|nr:pyruvate kinase [Sulfobacillus sp. hq2]